MKKKTIPTKKERAVAAEQTIYHLLKYIGEDPHRDGLKETPKRVVKSYSELFSGYKQKPKDIFTVFEHRGSQSMVLLRDIELYSMCEHHMLPFYGKAHIAYIPQNGKVVGISKLARLLDIFSRRLQIQERICEQVTAALMEHLKPKGAACVIEAVHMCMCARGVNKQNSKMVTSSLKGAFLDEIAVREEFMKLIG
jgi:GTP cyclohydrolase IA